MLSQRLSGPAFATALRLSGAGLGFIAQLVLARLMTQHALGVYFAAASVASVIGLLVTQGYPGIASRFVSRYRETKRPRQLAAFIRFQLRDTTMLATGATLLLGAAALAWPVDDRSDAIAYFFAALTIPAVAALSTFTPLANATRRLVLCFTPESIFRPILLLAGIAVIGLSGVAATAGLVTALFAGVTTIVAFAQAAIFLRYPPTHAKPAASARLVAHWRREARPLVIVTMMVSLFADFGILVASLSLSSGELAAFGISLKLAMLVGFAVQVGHLMAGPDLGDAHARRDKHRLHGVLLPATVFPVTVTALATVAAIMAGDRVLALFGPDFVGAHAALVILVASQFARALFGPSVVLLSILGRQVANAWICFGAAAMLVALMGPLGSWFGLVGAASAVLLTQCCWGLAAGWALASGSGLRSDLLAAVRRLPAQGRPEDEREPTLDKAAPRHSPPPALSKGRSRVL